ncbi:MAG: UPF0280 family protein [Desulfosalsimonadaceae bacterium]
MGEPRLYREHAGNRHLEGYRVCVRETDLWVQTETRLEAEVREAVLRHRACIESYIGKLPVFFSAMAPVALSGPAPGIIRNMLGAARAANVGPMAAVAGAMAGRVGKELLGRSREVMVENGGDIFVKLDAPFTLAIDAGASPLSYKIGLRLDASVRPLGVCTSSGTIGHSLSFGRADAVCVVSESCALADAAATAIGNRVKAAEDIDAAIAFGRWITGVSAVAVIVGDRVGLWGDTAIVPVRS